MGFPFGNDLHFVDFHGFSMFLKYISMAPGTLQVIPMKAKRLLGCKALAQIGGEQGRHFAGPRA